MVVVACAAAVTVVAFLFGRATRPKVQVKTVPLTFIGLLSRVVWWLVSRSFLLLWALLRLVISEVSSW